ncbi:MAG: Serine/threonine-protein kinase [Microgenomates group bacterium Gr01-1014_7]|nr:MAG: Serine/threonine-protein kinase [Microgenomates group bacterium Gr01-1014_7]
MKKILVWILVLISIAAIFVRYSNNIAEVIFGIKQKSGISIQSSPNEAIVYLDEVAVGKTPYEDKDLGKKEYLIKLESEGASWQARVKLESGTVTIINRDLAREEASSAGEILSLEKGRGITVVSNPSDSEVEIDGKAYGKTPISINLAAGDHTLTITHKNYLNRSIRANLHEGFNLTVSVDLALSEADLTSISAPVISQTPEVVVKQTPTGFLRVRDKASLSGKEIGRVNVGEKLVLLEETEGWDRVRLSDGSEGFVSSAYVEKKTP